MKTIIMIAIIFLLAYSLLPSAVIKIAYQLQTLKTQNQDKNIYLTFDDGPTKEYTPQLLDLLKQYKIKACFFIVSNFAKENPDIVKRMQADGHQLGIHSANHQNALVRGYGFLKKDFATTLNTMAQLGCQPHFYRPPWGNLNIFTFYFLKKHHLNLVLWQVMAEDWEKRAKPETIQEKILKRVRPGSIICLHDGRGAKGAPQNTIEALKNTIPLLLQQGYAFKSLEERL